MRFQANESEFDGERMSRKAQDRTFTLVVFPDVGRGVPAVDKITLEGSQRNDITTADIADRIEEWEEEHGVPVVQWKVTETTVYCQGRRQEDGDTPTESSETRHFGTPSIGNSFTEVEYSEGETVDFIPGGSESVYGVRSGSLVDLKEVNGEADYYVVETEDGGTQKILEDWIVD